MGVDKAKGMHTKGIDFDFIFIFARGLVFPIPDSRFPTPDSRFPIPDSGFPIPDSRFP
ncbi:MULTISPECIES: hypothetical protein [Moorena]|uniref:hypothetical protein n=1 Tax=Moorena TaxID=1155738 RepID=UPI0013B73139|nr:MULTISPECIES: hypothetical protein [Moorena]NEQ08067.1 hypothetical protein [Moorena sp. SIO4E2]NES44234.1 hypothetical protein [Moorena sp. SIO2C4]